MIAKRKSLPDGSDLNESSDDRSNLSLFVDAVSQPELNLLQPANKEHFHLLGELSFHYSLVEVAHDVVKSKRLRDLQLVKLIGGCRKVVVC